MTVIVQDKSGAEAEKNTAKANLFNAVALFVVLVIIVATISSISYFLIPTLWAIVKFVALSFSFLTCLMFVVGLLVINKDTAKSKIDAGITNRENFHQTNGWKPVAECSTEEKEEFLKKENIRNFWWNVVSTNLWVMPLSFGGLKQLQFIPANIFAPIATLLGLIVWIMLVNNQAKTAQHIDDKMKSVSFGKLAFYKIYAWIMAGYFLLVIGQAAMTHYGIDTSPIIGFFSQFFAGQPR